MRSFLSITLIIFSISAVGQSYDFKPDWKVGEKKILKINQIEREYEDEALISDTIVYNEAEILVVKDEKDFYTLEIKLENQALKAVIDLYDKMGEELKAFKVLKLIYTVDKESGSTDLTNWKESQKFMDQSIDQITKILEKKVPDVAPYAGLVFMPIVDIFKSKENIESYMASNFGYIFMPFKNSFELGDTMAETESMENPFSPMQNLSATTLLTLISVNESNRTAIFHQETQLDLSEFIDMMKGMVKKMSESFGASDSLATEKGNMMDDFHMDVTNLEVIEFNYGTSWITKSVKTVVVLATEPGTNTQTRKEMILTSIIE